jgi:regulator of sigma E protease
MILTIFIVIISLLFLVTIHELGHFLLARKFGVKVEEFGIGIPPKIVGKKIGETVYSLNLIPLGAFVKLYGEEERIQDSRSFSGKPIWQRVLIVSGGVVAFWIIAAIIISIVAGIWGLPMQIEDTDQGFKNPQIEIAQVMKNSPAYEAQLRTWDIVEKAKTDNNEIITTKVGEFVDFIDIHKGEEVILTIKRGKEILNIALVPRVNPPEGEGPIGIVPARVALKVYPWRKAIIQGLIATGNQTLTIIYTLGSIISTLIRRMPLPKGALEVTGVIGIFELLVHAFESGVNNFLLSLAWITIFLAIFNVFPIPALDGGKLLFLTIEKIRKKPVSQKIEEKITVFFFGLIMMLGILIIIKDIITRIS